ncbi:hypothetical protein BESB_085310 [Besnoitia besnoiti]|uniref:DDH domain-containing protein n=1 Tax=Besnoitia besnoiti TaxID=94643 RepID=A0A2A9MD86_BESBE|nr:hypothetical protein BESB_085310 [Besnoitia besnoiti]PFH33332.1 hypothetical protein BESB_085310 [Besnoitia besnoiti]
MRPEVSLSPEGAGAGPEGAAARPTADFTYRVAFTRHASLAIRRSASLRALLRDRQRAAAASPSSSSTAAAHNDARGLRAGDPVGEQDGGASGPLLQTRPSLLVEIAAARERKARSEEAGLSAPADAAHSGLTAGFPAYLTNAKAFLRACKESAANAARKAGKSGAETEIVLVLGNTSADLDSISAAVTYAMFLEFCRFTFEPLDTSAGAADSAADVFPRFVPFVQCLSCEYSYRLQTRWWLEHCGAEVDDAALLFQDSPAIQTLLTQPAESATAPLLCLVDHNALTPANIALQKNVISILDHHVVLPEARASLGAAFAVDIPGPSIGSCCTLVAQLWGELETATESVLQASMDATLFLLGAVAVDTTACDPLLFRDRWNLPDKEALGALWRRAEAVLLPHGLRSPEELVEAFGKIKYDVPRQLALGLPALMRADYKEFLYTGVCGRDLNVGISALTVPLAEILEAQSETQQPPPECAQSFRGLRLEFAKAAAELMEEQNLRLVVGLSNYRPLTSLASSAGLQRQVAMIAKKEFQHLAEGAMSFIVNDPAAEAGALQELKIDTTTKERECTEELRRLLTSSLTDIFFLDHVIGSQMPFSSSDKGASIIRLLVFWLSRLPVRGNSSSRCCALTFPPSTKPEADSGAARAGLSGDTAFTQGSRREPARAEPKTTKCELKPKIGGMMADV